MGILETIRRQPESQKKIFSLTAALILTLFIVGLWFSFTRNSSDDSALGEEQSKLSSISPMQVIKDEFAKAFSVFDNQSSSTETAEEIPISSEPELDITATSTEDSTQLATSSEKISTTSDKIN